MFHHFQAAKSEVERAFEDPIEPRYEVSHFMAVFSEHSEHDLLVTNAEEFPMIEPASNDKEKLYRLFVDTNTDGD